MGASFISFIHSFVFNVKPHNTVMYIIEIDNNYYNPPPSPLTTTIYKQLLTAPLTPHPAGGTLPVLPAGPADPPPHGSKLDNCNDHGFSISQNVFIFCVNEIDCH